VLFSSWNRPLLYDEFVYFVAGSLSPLEILSVIHETTTNVNQGVTGAYLLFDWVLMQAFGAEDWALRLPSLVFGFLFILYSLVFLRHKGIGTFGLTLFPVFLLTQELVMHYVGEARTYMPLAAAVVGLLTYYSANETWRCSPAGRVTGWSAAIIGVLFHPYIALYWPAILLFGYWTQHRGRLSGQQAIRTIVRWSNPAMVISGVLVYVSIALATWARGRATAFVDPFNFLPGPLPVEILIQNFYAFVPMFAAVTTGLALVVSAAAVFLPDDAALRRETFRLITEPLVLFVMAFALAFIVALTSITADFWIFPRQWIASTALAALATFWGGFLLFRRARVRSSSRGRITASVLTAAVVIAAGGVATQQVAVLREWTMRLPMDQPDRSSLAESLERVGTLSDGEWIEYSQVNLDQGGPVWPEFRSYYLDTDWTQFVLQD